jgi:uncharacterized membrane protein
MAEESKPNKTLFIMIAIVGVLLLLIVIFLMASEKISVAAVLPFLIVSIIVSVARLILSNMKSKR